ncbi:MAG: permease, partial [Gemmatimonadetes bacterium]|nr:permease [Gemmatimonadota bacterium]
DATSLSDVALYNAAGLVTLTTEAGAERVGEVVATASLLSVLRIHPVLGRPFTDAENVLNGPDVALLTWEAWQSRYGGDSTVIGRRVTLDNRPYEIVGVLPPGLQIDRTVDAPTFWTPALRDSSDLVSRRNRNYRMLARLAPGIPYGVATEQAARVLRIVSADTTIGARVAEWQSDQARATRGPLLMLLAAAGLLLLIACLNVSVLQLGEATARAREMATRAALGAGVARIVRQLLMESVVLSSLGALLGTGFAWFMIRGLVAVAPERVPGLDTAGLDARALAFAVGCAVGTGILFGILPSLIAGRAGVAAIVRSGDGQSSRGSRHVQRALVAIQLALCMVLLVQATLLSWSLRRLTDVDPGFHAEGLTAVKVALPPRFTDDQRRAFTSDMMSRLESYPGIERATASTHVPFVSGAYSSPVELDAVGGGIPPEPRHTQQRYVRAGYFEMLGMHLLSGRAFTADDRVGGELVAIVSASEVQRDFGGQSPLGRQVKHQGRWRRIVGVVADVKYRGLTREDEATIYVPFEQLPDATPVFILRGAAASSSASAIRAMLREVEPRATLSTVVSVPTVIQKSYTMERYRTILVTAFGVMAALLAAVGLYGVSLRTAKQRTREIGIRLALGATSRAIVQLLVSDAMTGVLVGLLVGTPAALLVAGAIEPYLFGISPRNPAVFAGVAVSLVAATVIASVLPARRAGRQNPAVVLRSD